jgi:hypothetical protein
MKPEQKKRFPEFHPANMDFRGREFKNSPELFFSVLGIKNP